MSKIKKALTPLDKLLSPLKAVLKRKVLATFKKYPSFIPKEFLEYLLNNAFVVEDDDDELPISEGDLQASYNELVEEFLREEVRLIYNDLRVEENPNCCGLGELSFSGISAEPKELLYLIIKYICKECRFTAVQMTQAYQTKVKTWPAFEKELNKLATPVYLGKSPRTRNHIYSWMIPAHTL